MSSQKLKMQRKKEVRRYRHEPWAGCPRAEEGCNQVHVPAIALADNYCVAVVRALLQPGAQAIALADNYCVALVRALLQPGACTSYCTSRQLLRSISSSTIAARCAGYCTRRQLLRCTSSCTVALVDNYCTGPKLLYSTRLLHNAVRCTSSSCSKLLQSYARASVAHFCIVWKLSICRHWKCQSENAFHTVTPHNAMQSNAMQYWLVPLHWTTIAALK